MDLLERRRIILPNSENLLYDGSNLVCDGVTFFDTGFAPFSADNYNKNFKMVFRFSSYPTQTENNAVFIGCKYEGTLNGQQYPGFYVIRKSTETAIQIGGYNYYETTSANILNQDIVLWRRGRNYYAKIGDAAPSVLSVRETQFNQNIVIGAGEQTNGTKFRYGKCTFDYFRLEYI